MEFGKQYKEDEETKRKSVLNENIKYIFKHNKEARLGKHTYSLGINQFSDFVNIHT